MKNLIKIVWKLSKFFFDEFFFLETNLKTVKYKKKGGMW